MQLSFSLLRLCTKIFLLYIHIYTYTSVFLTAETQYLTPTSLRRVYFGSQTNPKAGCHGRGELLQCMTSRPQRVIKGEGKEADPSRSSPL